MCGIAGIADPSGMRRGDPELVDAMLRTLAHRGPDDHLVRAEAGAVLGTRRLSIIDVTGGRQPLANEDETVVATQNGEIYNYVELRRDLIARGHTLRSVGDTEVLVHLYEDHGEHMVEHLRGMFAIAIWDARRGRLLLARDRVGKKPLYWRLDQGRIAYGSELKALLADPAVGRTVDRNALALFLAYQYVPAPHTILAGIHKLPPASLLVWDGGEPRIERYWTPEYEPKRRQGLEEDRDACLEVLREAVRIRLRSDVPIGSFLSGGVDSSVVTALMAQQSSQPVRTFTIGFEVASTDERRHAEAVARHYSTEHTTEVVTLDAIGLLPQLARAYDEPFGDPSAIPTLRVAQLAGRDLKVVLTGDGGDELFAGYGRYVLDRRLGLSRILSRPLASLAVKAAAGAVRALSPRSLLPWRLGELGRVLGLPADERYEQLMRVMSPTLEGRLMHGERHGAARHLVAQLAGGQTTSRIDQLLRLDTLNYLPEDLLVKMDRATMAVSLEARSPLLDQEVVAFASHLPAERKLHGGRSKILLREVARTLLPAGIADRSKQGFSVPVNDWFRGALGARFQELALAPDAYLRDVVDQQVAAELYAEHIGRTRRHGHRLWQLLSLELWGRTWIRGRTEPHRGA